MRVCFILLLGRLTYHNHLSTFSRFVCYKACTEIFWREDGSAKRRKRREGAKPKTKNTTFEAFYSLVKFPKQIDSWLQNIISYFLNYYYEPNFPCSVFKVN